MEEKSLSAVKSKLEPKKNADKEWYLSLLDGEKQLDYEKDHLAAVLLMLKICYVRKYLNALKEAKAERAAIRTRKDYSAEDYRATLEKNAEIEALNKKLNGYQCYFSEPYFARIDVTDDKEGYNSYYIGKKGDVNLSIVDWRAPLAVRYYQKSRVDFSINEYDYHTVLRRALSVKNGKVLDFKNEYLSVRDVLTGEEIAGRDEEILFDPYLRSIIESRKEDVEIRDIIRTIQEQQFEIINLPERESFILQGCAGSGKTMILLHRLSYLMYNNESLRPHDVLVITPSDSFNDFIDELSKTLELGKVMTVTLQSYFYRVLENEGLDLRAKLKESKAQETPDYLAYLYSEAFARDAQKKINKLYGDIAGLFTGEECRGVVRRIQSDCKERGKRYVKLKNASTRVRRAVLGEMKEREDGGFDFSKPFRGLMSAYIDLEDFLNFVLDEEPRTPDYFFRQFIGFYKSAHLVCAASEKVFARAQEDCDSLYETVQREIVDLKRYRLRRGENEVYTYPDRIQKREELLEEISAIKEVISEMGEGVELLNEFFTVVRSSKACMGLGKCENGADIARWLYRETVKEYKKKFCISGLCPSDGFSLCLLLSLAGRSLTPRYGLVFVDEGQDVSYEEYALLRRINGDAAFNVFGDLRQNITPWRGVGDWDKVCDRVYYLDRNYRNTNEIVEYVRDNLNVSMVPIGLHGKEVCSLGMRRLTAFFKDRQGLKAVITREENLPLFRKRGYSLLREKGKLSKSQINVMTVYESKGLEFSAVAVYDKDMTDNEKYIAYTRALSELALVKQA